MEEIKRILNPPFASNEGDVLVETIQKGPDTMKKSIQKSCFCL